MGWETYKLGDICDFQNGFAFKSKLFSDSGTPILRISNIQNGFVDLKKVAYTQSDSYKENLEKYKVFPGDLLIAMSGATTGKIGINNTDAIFFLNQRVGKFSPHEVLDKRYLYFYLSTKVAEHLEVSQGAAQPNLSTEQIKNIEIPLPTIEEQKRIVAILDEAFADIDKARALTERNLENARELFESYLQYAFTSQDETWTENNLGSVCEVSSGGTPKKSNMDYWDGDIPWYSSGELNAIHTCSPNEKITPLGLKESNAKLFPKGSLLIGMYDTAALKMSILDRDGAFNQAIAGVKPNQNVNLEFIRYSIEHIKPSLLKLRRGVRQKNLNQNKIKGIPVALPPLDTQNRIVGQINRVYSSVENLLTLNETKLTYLESLKKSLLQKAFTGELTKAA